MAKYVFVGRVLPERAQVFIPPTQIRADATDARLTFEATISIELSVVTVHVETQEAVSNLYTLRNYVEYCVAIEVATLGFTNGCGYDVEIIMEITNVPPVIFGVQVPELAASEPEIGPLFEELRRARNLGARSVYFHRALLDYRDAIRRATDSWYLCYRAVESILQAFVPESAKSKTERSVAWVELHRCLNTTQEYLAWLTGPAAEQRHGKILYVSPEDRLAALKTVREMVRRFAAHLIQQQPLDLQEYPLLNVPYGPVENKSG